MLQLSDNYYNDGSTHACIFIADAETQSSNVVCLKPMTTGTLGLGDVSMLANQLNEIAASWDLFVGMLGVAPHVQHQISLQRDKHPRFAQICLVDGLQHWVVSDPSPTVEKVIAALSSRTINNKLLAAEIARKWGVQGIHASCSNQCTPRLSFTFLCIVSVDDPALEVQTDCTATSQTEAMCTRQGTIV